MKYGYNFTNSIEYYKLMENLYCSNFGENFIDFMNNDYRNFMKRKTITESELKAFEILKEMINEMDDHIKEMKIK